MELPLYPGSGDWGGGRVNEILRTPLAMQLKPGEELTSWATRLEYKPFLSLESDFTSL